MQQFFIEDFNNPKLSSDQTRQCVKVLRMRAGDHVRLVDAKGMGGIFAFTDKTLTDVKLIETLDFPVKKRRIRLIASLIRSERLEWMIQKACECGVDEIVLYSAHNGVVRDFGERSERKIERLNAIAKEASEQSYRQFPVHISGVIKLKEIEDYKQDVNLYADVNVEQHIVTKMGDGGDISIIIGPEGGFSDNERDSFKDYEFSKVSLGNSVLRAETASIVACVLIEACEEIR